MFYFYIIVLLVTLATVALLMFYLTKLYFRYNGKKYSKNSNFLSKYALYILFSGFCVITPNISDTILNFFISLSNEYLGTHINTYSSEFNYLSLSAFIVLCLVVLYIVQISYSDRLKKEINKKFVEKDEDLTEFRDIEYPKNAFSESPNLKDRLTRCFELKYKKKLLKLQDSTRDKILYGSIQDGFRKQYLFIHYSENFEVTNFTKEEIKSIYNLIQDFSTKIIDSVPNENVVKDFYFITEEASFDKEHEVNIFCKTENDILNELINFDSYLKNLIQGYHGQRLFSAIAKNDEQKTLSETFIPPPFNVKDVYHKKGLEDYLDLWLQDSSDSKHIVLLGDSGMGKTSFLKFYSCQLANKALMDNNFLRFPVFISLTNTSPSYGGIEEKIKAFVAENLGEDYALFEILLHKGKLLFILDGFDEMGFVGSNEDRFNQIQEIWQLAHKNNKLIISGRKSYFSSEYEMRKTLNVVETSEEIIQTEPYSELIELCKLEDDQIKLYISKYYPKKVKEYYGWILKSRSLKELCSRPSMMHIIREMLPDLQNSDQEQKEVYTQRGTIEKYVKYWINRQYSKNIRSAFNDRLKKDEFIMSFFTELAIELFIVNQESITPDYIKEKVIKHIDKFDVKKLNKKYQIEGFQRELVTSYFVELNQNHFHFVHKSFFEYFVASTIISKIKSRDFKSPILFYNWSNTIVDFVYDEIPEKLKVSKSVPALISLKNEKRISELKSQLFKFFFLWYIEIIGIVGIMTLIISSYFFFGVFELSILLKIILYLPYLLWFIIVITIIAGVLSNTIGSIKGIKFIKKAYKIAFVKGQFDSKDNLNLVRMLIENDIQPYIPLGDLVFNNEVFSNTTFYNLKNVDFINCEFENVYFEDCEIENVKFDNVTFGYTVFRNCKLNNVSFRSITFNIPKKKTFLRKKVIDVSAYELLFFNSSKLDNSTCNTIGREIAKNESLLLSIVSSKLVSQQIQKYYEIHHSQI